MNLDDVDGRFGEAYAGTSPDGSHINLVIGRRGSPTAAAAAAAMADVRAGHTPFLLCLGSGNLVRPVTVVRNKTPLDSEHLELLTWGAVQLGIGQGVCDAVDEGLLPLEHVDDLVLLIAVYVDPAAAITPQSAWRTGVRRATRSRTRCRATIARPRASWWPAARARQPLLPRGVAGRGGKAAAERPWANHRTPRALGRGRVGESCGEMKSAIGRLTARRDARGAGSPTNRLRSL